MPELTPQQKALEKLYRGKSAARSPTLKQKSLNRSFNKPSVNKVRALEKSRVSQSVRAKSKLRQLKTATSKNISKFGGGVKARLGGTLAATKKLAVKQGVKTLSLGKIAVKSKFLAGINSVPGVALLAGNYVVWKNNIKQLQNIYRGANPGYGFYQLPNTQQVINPAQEPPFLGGQSDDVDYLVTVRRQVPNPNSYEYFRDDTLVYRVTGPIQGIEFELFGRGYNSATNGWFEGQPNDAYDVYLRAKNPSLINLGQAYVEGGSQPPGGLNIFEITNIVRRDGQPDTGGNLSTGTEAQTSTGGVVNNNQIINNYITNNITVPPPISVFVASKPPTNKATPTTSNNNKVVSTPDTVNVDKTVETEDINKVPVSVTDSPPIQIGDPTSNPVDKKPKRITRTKSYPLVEPQPQDTINRDLTIQDVLNKPSVEKNLKVRRLDEFGNPVYWDNRLQQEVTTTTTTTGLDNKLVPPAIRPVTTTINRGTNSGTTIKTNVDTRFNPDPTKRTSVNPCKKGCGGASGGSGGSSLTPAESNALLQLADLALLKKIDTTTTATKTFMEKAWSFTKADKILNGLSAIASIHNAAMLSQDVGQTLGDAATSALNLFNITNAEGEAIDVNSAIGGAIKDKINSIFPEATTTAITSVWLGLNRIHQAVSATVSAVHGTKNALLEADEITGGHIAQIGNALQDQGVIEEDSYDFMNTEPDYRTNFNGILGKIENIENIAERVSSVVSTGLEIKETSTELITTSDELKEATDDFLTNFNTERDSAITQSQSPNIDRLDLLKQETDGE